MTWTTDFISRCLNGIPKDKYRKRAQDELTDHLLTLCSDLEGSGLSPEEAQARTVELMGEPEELNESFREEWVRRATSWKYYLRTAFSISIHAYAFNLLVRWFLFMPVLLFGKGVLFDWLESDSPLPFVLFSVLNFLPGVWFTTHEWYRSLALHPQRKRLLLCGLLCACFWEIGPLLGNLGVFPFMFFLPLVMVGHFPIILLLWDSEFYIIRYAVVVLLVAIAFAAFYAPRTKSK